MTEFMLGIDCGGTHTDAALIAMEEGHAKLLAAAKTITRHDDLPGSIGAVLKSLADTPGCAELVSQIRRVTLGATLEINALVQGKADKVGLALCSGPGIDPAHFAIGDFVCIVPGGLDHRGVEVKKLYLDTLQKQAAQWAAAGVSAIACVGKFSPRNPEHENLMAKTAQVASGLPVTVGHHLAGQLNFPRRIATAYYNAAVGRIHENFLDSVEKAFTEAGMDAQFRLLKADGGAVPFNVSRKEPVQSILSGPAASVMGALALWPDASVGSSLLLDMGGTTTDIAMFLNGSPVVDRQGMSLGGRRTLVRSLASISIGVGGDSILNIQKKADGEEKVCVGPNREGPAMAFGGSAPTFLDALNYLDGENSGIDRGDVKKSRAGIEAFAEKAGRGSTQAQEVAREAVQDGLNKIVKAVYNLVENVNSRPIYTLAGLKAVNEARPDKCCLVGGPAHCVRERLQTALGMKVELAPHPEVANAIGAALARPTSSLEVYADTGKRELAAPAINYREKIPPDYTLEQAKEKTLELLRLKLQAENIRDAKVEVVEADMFATLDDHGRGARDMRVVCQGVPGLLAAIV